MADNEADVTAVRDLAGLVTAAQAGDQDALSELISDHLTLVYSVVGRALHGHTDVDDVVQDTMVRVIRGLPGLREPDRFPAWVAAIAHRQVQLYLRDRRKQLQRRQEIVTEQPDTVADFAERTVTQLVLAGQRRELTEAAGWLDHTDRRLLSLLWRETLGELTRPRLAAMLNVSQKHAGSRLRRMKAQLDAVRVVIRALQASPRCPDLAAVVHGWNGEPSTVWRKRLTRHMRDCPPCARHGHGLVPPERLLLGVVALPIAAGFTAEAPAAGAASSIWTAVQNLLSNKVVAASAAATVAAGGGVVYAVHETPNPGDRALAIVRPTTATSAAVPAPGSSPTATTAISSPPAGGPPGATGVTSADIYVAPGGSDTGAGTIDRPYATLGKAVAMVRPGQTIAVRGGTYQPTDPVVITTSGDAQRRITLSNYRNERPIIDAGRVPTDKWMITHRASYWTVQGLEIENSGSHAYVCRACRYNVLRRLSIHDNVRSALTLRDAGTIGNQILDNDLFNNYDPAEAGKAGIGLGLKDGSGGRNLIRGNRAFNNADNGFDLGGFTSPVTLEHNWAYGNGINRWNAEGWQSNADGFHLGGGNPTPAAAHHLRDNAAWDNVGSGFSSSGNHGPLQLTNNTAFRNGGDGFYLLDATGTVNNNAAGGNAGAPATLADGTAARDNRWERGDDGPALFRSTDPTLAQGPRTVNGSLPSVDFLATYGNLGAAMSGLPR